ncbi:hypothetical protein ACHAPU_006552, partial [Fusarium lateritium]
MPPYAAELETWWLGSGYEAIKHLVNGDIDDLNPRQCGFAQQLQTRLLAFDNDRTIQAQIRKAWPTIRAARGIDYDANTRKYAKCIASTIFRKPKDGSMNFNRVMDGLGYVDAMEIRRLRLIEATRNALKMSTPSEADAQLIEELDRTATVNFRHIHAGFRTCILIEELKKDANTRKEVPQIIALLNALVPSAVLLGDKDDTDPTPYSPGLRDSVRFSIFEHLMSEDSFSSKRQEIIEVKLRCWCDVPGYPRARDALVRYSEEFKKLENVCLKVMNELERRSMTDGSYPAISGDSSMLSGADTSHNSSLLTNSLQDDSTTRTSNTSIDNQHFTPTSPTSPCVTLDFHPLLRGMPGRELSPASTDGAMFARDLSAVPVLSYPDNFSKTEFFQHPFARKLEMSFAEQYDPDSDDEAKEDVPPVSPLPHIPERLRAHLTPNVLNKIKKKMRYQPDKTADLTLDGVPFQTLDQYAGASRMPKPKARRRRPMLNASISETEGITDASPQKLHSEDSSCEVPGESLGLVKSPKWSHRQITDHGHQLKCQLLEPRLSPMEYCRMYLVEKALSERENRQCELPKPDQKWYWTRYYKKFLIVPQIPQNIRRGFAPTTFSLAGSDGDSVSTLTPEVDYTDLERLSLHLDHEAALLPSFTDTPLLNVTDAKILDSPDSNEEVGNGVEAEADREGHSVLLHRGLAGGEVDDWRPMSEYERDEHDGAMNEVLAPDTSEDSIMVEKSNKLAESGNPTYPAMNSDTPAEYWSRQSPKTPGKSSLGPDKSAEEAVPPGNSEQFSRQSDGPRNLSLSRQLSRVCAKDLSVLDFATPGARSRVGNKINSLSSLATTSGHSPLARFPIVVQPTHRLTPGTLTKRVIGESGGQFLSEDTRQVRLIPSPSSQLHQGLQADVWDADPESMISELQPEPLNINQRRPRAITDDDRRWSKMFDGLSSAVSPALRRFGMSSSVGDEGVSSWEVDSSDCTSMEGDRTPRGLGNQLQSLAHTTPEYGGLRRSVSTIITPTQSMRRLRPKASFNLENIEHSGFTPEHAREDFSNGTFPRSGIMLNLQNTQARLNYPLQEADKVEPSKGLDSTTPRTRRLPDVPDFGRYQQNLTPRDWMRAVTSTPPKTGIIPRNEGSIETADCTTNSFQTGNISNEGDVQSYQSIAIQDFPQSHKLGERRPKQRLTPSGTHRFSKQRFDRSIQAPPLPLSRDGPGVTIRRTPSPTMSQNTIVPRTPSSGISSIFRKRIRSEYNPPTTPKTPASPRLAWRPFDDDEPEPPCSSPWVSGNGEGKREKERRAAYFREKAEREIQGRQSPKRPTRRESFSTIPRDCTSRNDFVPESRLSNESLVNWRNFITDAPEPLFSSPLPPVPPLPSESQLNLALSRLPQARTPSRAVSGFETSPVGTYRAKKPQGLRVETQRPRRTNRDGARTPSRSATLTPASESSFRTAFCTDGRPTSSEREAWEDYKSS